jgi:hypothetical protein
MSSLLSIATALASRGWHVFPLRPGSKRPALAADWEGRATTDPERIARCWAVGEWNIGVACGPSGLVVIDLDKPKTGQSPPAEWARLGICDGADVLAAACEWQDQPLPFETYIVRTGSGGLHLYFAAPPGTRLGNTAGRLGWLVDTRAHGGYVVAAGSIVDGHGYTVVYDRPPAALPRWLTGTLAGGGAPARAVLARLGASPYGSEYARTALLGEVQLVLDAGEGSRNHTLNRAAFALGQLAATRIVPSGLAYDALMAAASRVGLTAREADRTIRSGLAAGGRKPRGAAA